MDLISPMSSEPLAQGWRDRLAGPNGAHPDPAVRDRDHKLLAWLEYAEMLSEGQFFSLALQFTATDRAVHAAQQALRRELMRDETPTALISRAAEGVIDIWRRYSSRWEAWAGSWSARTDP